jgi:aspartyl-tRNA(Asn)/glutamyl-tRNA(Gln) amidotransferase subunit B
MSAALNRSEIDITQAPVSAHALAQIIERIDDGTLSASMARQVFEAVWSGEGAPDAIIEARGLQQVTDAGAIESIVDKVIAANADQVAQFRAGKHKVLGYLVGQVMKASDGALDPKQVNALMREKLGT